MRTEIKAIFFDYSPSEVENIIDELIKFDYVLYYKIINNILSIDTEINKENWDIIVTKRKEAENILEAVSDTSKNTCIIIASENWDSEFFKSSFSKGFCDVVVKPKNANMALSLIRNYEKSRFIKKTVLKSDNAKEKLEKLSHELMKKNKELENVVYITSHDIRSPVVNILGFSDEMNKMLDKLSMKIFDEANVINNKEEIDFILEKDIPRLHNFIRLSGQKIEKMLLALLKLSRLGRNEITATNIDMNNLVGQCIRSFDKIEQKIVKISIDDLPGCFADEILLSQIFTSLIDNVIKFRSKRTPPEIKISAEKMEDSVRYSVSDNGIGISESEIDKIFDVFYRINPDKTEGEGIGLSLLKKAVERIGAEISVESKLENKKDGINGETTFYITVKNQSE